MKQQTSKSTQSITLPRWVIIALVVLMAAVLGVAIWIVLQPFGTGNEELEETPTAATLYLTTVPPTTTTTTAATTVATESVVITSMVYVPVPATQGFQPYTVYLDATTPIYGGPSAGYGYVCSVGESGKYTIVEEQHTGGQTWGRLKSGLGWVQLGATYTPTQNNYYVDTTYTVYLDASAKIYSGPGFEYGCVGTVGQSTKYTIVEEYISGLYCFGRLKSGLGWVLVA